MSPVRKRREPAPLSEPLSRLLARYDPEGRLRVFRVFDVWDEVVGEAIARRAQPVSVRDATLAVQVSSHTWMQELQFLKDDIRRRLNERLGDELIREVQLAPGRIRAKPRPRARPDSSIAVVVPTLPSTGSPEVDDVLRRIATAAARQRAATKRKAPRARKRD